MSGDPLDRFDGIGERGPAPWTLHRGGVVYGPQVFSVGNGDREDVVSFAPAYADWSTPDGIMDALDRMDAPRNLKLDPPISSSAQPSLISELQPLTFRQNLLLTVCRWWHRISR